jgi:hypothetical protein
MNENEKDGGLRPMPDFRVESERLRLGPGGFRVFFNIAGQWKLSDEEALKLLALESGTPMEQLKFNPASQLFTTERMLRISYIIGIYQGLHICYGNDLANQWIKLRSRNRIFGGISPLEFMIRGGLDAMHRVRELIDAQCADN